MAMDENALKRILPHSDEAEISVVGSMLIDPETIIVVSNMITGEDFYNRSYGIIFDTMCEMYEAGKNIDPVILQNSLREKNAPPEVSSTETISNIINSVPTSANIKGYAEIVSQKSMMRRMIRTNEKLAQRCYQNQDDFDSIMHEAEVALQEMEHKQGVDDITPIRQVVNDALAGIEAAYQNNGIVTGIATGFIDLDYKTAGFHPSELILVAARPAMGKTAFVLNLAQYMALKQNKVVAMFNLEMSKEQLVNRMFSLQSAVDAQKIRTGKLSLDDWGRLTKSATEIGMSKLVIDDTPGLTVNLMRSKLRKIKSQMGLDVVIIDYLQLMSGSGKSESRQNEISEISRGLKILARELNVPVIALSQLSRAVEQRPDHRPMLSDLRESGAIEQDADVVMFIYRDDYYNKDTDRPGISEIIIAKQRSGPIGTVELAWIPELTKFHNLEHARKQSEE